MSYVNITLKGGPVIAEGPGPLPASWRSISGFDNLPPEELARHGWYPWQEVPAPEVDTRTHKVVTTLEVTGGATRPKHEVVALTDPERFHLLAEGRRAKLTALAGVRWERETGGIEFDGIPLHTDRESQATITLAAMQGVTERWKGADGKWYDMDLERLQGAAQAVMAHKRACFAREEKLASEIRAADSPESLDDIDLEDGWPSTLA